MALVAIWGASAVGKSYFLKSIMDDLPDINPNITVVFGDNAEEYHYAPGLDAWLLKENHLRWQGKREEKLRWAVSDMITCEHVWVLESMRYFNGLQRLFVDAFIRNNCKGLSIIIPFAQPKVHQAFLQQRCDLRNKKMSEWWTPENCWKESNYRISSVEKYWKPAGVPSYVFEIDAERKAWNDVTSCLKSLIQV
jgi:hypothetical protein